MLSQKLDELEMDLAVLNVTFERLKSQENVRAIAKQKKQIQIEISKIRTQLTTGAQNFECEVMKYEWNENDNTVQFSIYIDPNIPKGSKFHLALNHRDSMQIFYKNREDKVIALDVLPSDTVECVKLKIQQKEGYPVINQSLVYAGKHLENQRTLREYKIHDLCTLYLNFRAC